MTDSEKKRYFGLFFGVNDVVKEFGIPDGKRPADEEIVFASYATPDCSGYAFVVFEINGILYEVSGSHCSCYGLEGQWEPEETFWEAMAAGNRLVDYEEHEEAARVRWNELLREHVPFDMGAK